MKLRIFLLAIIGLIFCGHAHAACPAGSTYGPLRNQTLSAAYGITTCFYAAASGSDSNAGTSEAAPFQHLLDSPNCANVCHTVAVSIRNSAAAGNALILKGGDTWNFGNSSAANYTGGTLDWNNSNYLGNATHQFYLGVDQTWFTGASWTRPIFTGDNPACNSGTLGANCFNAAFGTGGIFYVTTCGFQIASSTAGAQFQNDMLKIANLVWVVFDNIEFTGLCEGATGGNNGQVSDAYMALSAASNLTFQSGYYHNASHQKFSSGCANVTPTFPCFDMYAWHGSNGVAPTTAGSTYLYNVLDGSDSDPGGWGSCACDWYNMGFNYMTHISEGVPIGPHIIHDSVFDNWYDPTDAADHGNVIESHSDYQGVNVWYNNVLTNISPDGHNQVGLWPQPCAPASIGLGCSATLTSTNYLFGNVMGGVDNSVSGNYLNDGQNSNTGAMGNKVIFNNTWQINSGASPGILMSCNSTFSHPTTYANNQYITDNSSPYSVPCNFATFITDSLRLSNSAATTAGYTAGNSYAPTSGGSPSVLAGTNEQSICTTLTGSSDPLVVAAGNACKRDTTLGVVYLVSSHSIGGPARTSLARPASTAWDAGAFQFAGAGGGVSIAPSSFSYGTVTIGSNANSSSLVLTNSSGSTITFTGTTYTGANASDWTSASNTCTGSLATTGTCTVVAKFSPTAVAGTHETATLNVAYTGFAGGPQTVALDGFAGAPGVVTPPAPAPQVFTMNLSFGLSCVCTGVLPALSCSCSIK